MSIQMIIFKQKVHQAITKGSRLYLIKNKRYHYTQKKIISYINQLQGNHRHEWIYH